MLNYSKFVSAVKALLEVDEKMPTYVAVKPDLESIESLVELAEVIGLSNELLVPEDEMHCTITYTKRSIDDPSLLVRSYLPIEAVGDEFAIFDQRSGKKCLVLKMTSLNLRALHAHIKGQYGASHDFPTYEPHVTLCYDLPEGFKIPQTKPNVHLLFRSYEVKPLDDE